MTRKSKARYGLKRTYKINPTVKALRSALFLGLATAAAAPAVQAGTCVKVVNQVICAGDFNTTLDSWNELSVVDPFDPAIVELDADVSVYAEGAVNAWNEDDLTLITEGTLIAEAGWSDLGWIYGVRADANNGSLDFTNNGWVIADKDDGYWGYSGWAVGAYLQADEGITAVNNGLIAGTVVDDNGFGVWARNFNSGDISITNNASGDIAAFSDWRSATGIYAENRAGDITVVNDGRVAAEAEDWATGIHAEAYWGDVTISVGAAGEVDVNGWTATGIRAFSGDGNTITINNAGKIEATGVYAEGAAIYGDYRNTVNVSNYGDILVEGFSRAVGVNINGDGIDVAIDNFDTIRAYGGDNGNIGVYIDGMNNGLTDYGSVTLNNRGVIYAGEKYGNNSVGNASYGDAAGVVAISGGDITITNAGSYGSMVGIIAGTESGSAFGVYAESFAGDITISNGSVGETGKYSLGVIGAVSDMDYGTAMFGGQVAGISAMTGDGAVRVDNHGVVFAGNGNYGDAVGIRAAAYGGGMFMPLALYSAPGDVTVTNGGVVVAYADLGDATGIDAISDYGDITVTNSGTVRAGSDYFAGQATGVSAVTEGDINIGNTGLIQADSNQWNARGVYASTYDGYGSVVIANTGSFDDYGNIVAGVIDVDGAEWTAGIAAYSSSGTVTITNSGLIDAHSDNDVSNGIWTTSESGDITVTNTGTGLIRSNTGSAAYSAWGIDARSYAGGDVTVTNNGTVDVSGGYVYGINAAAYGGGDVTVTNRGEVLASASGNDYGDAVGISAIGEGDLVSVTNTGIVYATTDTNSGNATGIFAQMTGYGDIVVTNGSAGRIDAYADANDGDAFGIKTVMLGTGTTTVTNYGDIAGVYGEGLYGDDNAWGIHAESMGGDINITNAGTGFIYAYADEENGTGIQANAGKVGNIDIVNNGIVEVYGNWYAYGIVANAGNGTIDVTNTGSIDVYADGDDAFGVKAAGYGDITIGNGGDITVTAANTGYAYGISAENGDAASSAGITIVNAYGALISATAGYADEVADSYGIKASHNGYGDILIGNSGTVVAQSYDDAQAVWAYGNGDITVTNTASGKLYAESSADEAYGVYVWSNGDGDIAVTNAGDIEAVTTGESGDAYGVKAYANGDGNTTIGNSGDITASAAGFASDAFGISVDANNAGYGDITVTNAATGTVDASSAYGSATGIGIFADMNTNLNDGGDVIVGNAGDILVQSYGSAAGVAVRIDPGSIYTPRQYGFCNAYTVCTDVYGNTVYGGFTGVQIVTQAPSNVVGEGGMDVTVTNTGSIDVNSDYSIAEGISIQMGEGDYTALVFNSGDITVSGDGDALGVNARNNNYGDIGIWASSASTIDVTAGKYAQGIQANAESGDVYVYSEGSIASAAGKYAGGIDAWTNGQSWIRNTGDIDVTADNTGNFEDGDADAQGIRSWGAERSWVINSGDITVQASTDSYGGIFGDDAWASGIISASDFSTGSSGVYSDADIAVTATSQYGSAYAEGIFSRGNSAWIVTATGSSVITSATGEDWSRTTGLWANGNDGYAGVYNEGILTVSASTTGYGDASAIGIRADADLGDVWITNEGAVTASATVAYANWFGAATGIDADTYNGDIDINNKSTGTLTVTAQDYAAGISAYADYGDVFVTNAAAITVSATGYNGDAYGVYAETGGGDTTVVNSAAITVTAGDYAAGIYAYANVGDASVTNTATGHVRATGDSATGISVQSNNYGYDVTLNNAGKITVVGNDGDAYGAYVETDGYGTLSITSSGDITVTSDGYDTYAVGLYAQHEGYGDVNIVSGSKITVNNNSDYGDAVGIKAYADGGTISVNNSGTIVANANNAYGFSVGIYSENFGGYSTTITNSGSVKATGNYAWAIYHYGNDADITNAASGKIFGVIATDYGNDTFTNNGKWYATEGVNYVSEFQEGDDAIVNSATGKIYMEDSVIDMGSASQYGSNSFLNNGKVYVNGFANYVDMGTATSVFTNNGNSLHFEDGAANDHLTIFGDFAGTGKIVVDADGTSMLADRLYIDGDVVTNTANVIDVFMNEYPSLQDMIDGEEIDVVAVTGTSLAANFDLGSVTVAEDSLFTVDVSLNKHINYSGTNDLFSLGFEVSGLTPSGVAATSIAPAVQSLWHLGVGTVFQRQGTSRDGKGGASGNGMMSGFKDFNNAMQVADYQGASGVWLRAFTEDGAVSPDADRNFGMGGGQGFDLKNSGIEFGAGYAFNDQWTAGLLGGTSESSLRPDIGGRAKVNADTFGGYVTYTPGNGFYADFTYRSMDFDGTGNAGGDDFRFEGNADGYSLEVGYGFKTASGLIVEPQFQYSTMDISLDALDYAQGDFELTDGNSSQMRAGVALRKTFQAGSGDWTPYASLSFINETDASNNYLIGGVLTGNVDTSGNSTLVEGGATAHYGNMVFSGGINWKDGGAYDSLFGGQVSVRFTW